MLVCQGESANILLGFKRTRMLLDSRERYENTHKKLLIGCDGKNNNFLLNSFYFLVFIVEGLATKPSLCLSSRVCGVFVCVYVCLCTKKKHSQKIKATDDAGLFFFPFLLVPFFSSSLLLIFFFSLPTVPVRICVILVKERERRKQWVVCNGVTVVKNDMLFPRNRKQSKIKSKNCKSNNANCDLFRPPNP